MNIDLNYSTHCGVIDFTAEEDCCYLPYHMFQRLCLIEGMTVNLRNVVLDKGSFIKFRPHKTEFVMNPNPKVILENALRNYVCITKNDTITVEFNKKHYYIDVVECKPRDTICLTNVDVTVDFDTPVDYVEEDYKMKKQDSNLTMNKDEKKQITPEEMKTKIQNDKFQGNCIRVDGKNITEKQLKKIENQDKKKDLEESYDPRKHRIVHGVRNNFIAFKGHGVKIGK
jgi:ubiquitin fusion degradation protein 1